MTAELTDADGQEAVTVGLVTLPAAAGYVEVQVNGVAIKLGTDTDLLGGTFKPSAVFGKLLPTPFTPSISGNLVNIAFSSAHNLVSGDIITLTSASDVNFTTTVTHVNATNVTVPGNTPVITPSGTTVQSSTVVMGANTAYHVHDFSEISTGDKLLWFGSNAKFELDANDRISYIYIVPQQ